jgi:Tfp pilus assembly protein PilV
LPRPVLSSPKGFTLVDVIVSIAIAMVGLLPLVGLQSTAIQGNRSYRNLTSAVFLAQKKIEYFKNVPFASLSPVVNQADPNNPMTEIEGGGGIFNRISTIQSYGPSANMKQVTVTVTWRDGLGSHSIPLDTIVSK